MGEPIEISLRWRGPFRIPTLLDTAGKRRIDLQNPHVYFYIQEYPSLLKLDATTVYIGMASKFLDRMLEHYRGFLGLEYWLKQSDANWVCAAKDDAVRRVTWLDQVDRWSAIAIAEVKRLSFFAAPCPADRLEAVEAALINRVVNRVESEEVSSLKCDNGQRSQRGQDGPSLKILLGTDKSCSRKWADEVEACLTRVFGDKREIRWGMPSD